MQNQNEGRTKVSQRIDSLTGSRFLVILLVVSRHMEFLRQYGRFGEFYWRFFDAATLSVDYFFMLSGFGMMLSSMRKDPNGTEPVGGLKGLFNYGIKHIRKIYPIYVASLIFGIPYHIYTFYIQYGQPLKNVLLKGALIFSVDLALLQSVTGLTSFSHSFNAVCWFLSALFCIYLVSPVIMKVIKRTAKTVKGSMMLLGGTILASCALSFFFSWIDDHTALNDLNYVSPFRRVFYVIAGMLVAQIYDAYKRNESEKRTSIFASGAYEYSVLAAFLVWFFLRLPCQNLVGQFAVIIDMAIVSGVLFAFALGNGAVSKALAHKRIVYLGEISMYIFLLHYNIRMYVDLLVNKLKINSFFVAILEVIVIVAITLIASVTIHNYRNKPRAKA